MLRADGNAREESRTGSRLDGFRFRAGLALGCEVAAPVLGAGEREAGFELHFGIDVEDDGLGGVTAAFADFAGLGFPVGAGFAEGGLLGGEGGVHKFFGFGLCIQKLTAGSLAGKIPLRRTLLVADTQSQDFWE